MAVIIKRERTLPPEIEEEVNGIIRQVEDYLNDSNLFETTKTPKTPTPSSSASVGTITIGPRLGEWVPSEKVYKRKVKVGSLEFIGLFED